MGVVFILSGCGQQGGQSDTKEVPPENIESVSLQIDGFT